MSLRKIGTENFKQKKTLLFPNFSGKKQSKKERKDDSDGGQETEQNSLASHWQHAPDWISEL